MLEKRLAQQPDDREAQWLLLHAQYASVVRSSGDLTRFTKAADTYVASGGTHAPLVTEWLRVVSRK